MGNYEHPIAREDVADLWPSEDLEDLESIWDQTYVADAGENEQAQPQMPKKSYMVYYGVVTDEVIQTAKEYEVVILHPKNANLVREQVQEIQASGTKVLGYISIGEDLRTDGLTPEEMKRDPRFAGDKTGPRVDPRPHGTVSLDDVDPLGKESPGGSGYASYYLDDNDHDGKPDINVNFNCAFTNIGDPAWFEELEKMKMDGFDKIAGIREILTNDYGRGLGCDGLFLDTIDTCAPNKYTGDNEAIKTRFEWTAPGLIPFTKQLKEKYPTKLVLQNRGVFYFDSKLPHYKYMPRGNIDYLLYESYMLDSNTDILYYDTYFADNKYIFAPKIMAEASRPNGFEVLSLGYAEGPEEYALKDTLMGKSKKGMDVLMTDIREAQSVGFHHYITDGGLGLVNDFVITHDEEEDTDAPVWSSVYNDTKVFPAEPPDPRVGVREVEPVEGGVMVRWDVALDRNKVKYTLYYQKEEFDFEADPDLKKAQHVELIPDIGDGYQEAITADVYPYQAEVKGLDAGENYYFVIRAKDSSPNENEEKNTEVKSGVPK